MLGEREAATMIWRPTQIDEGLWQGAYPLWPPHGFDVIVLSAEEIQPEASHFPGVEVVRAPMADTGEYPSSEEIQHADAAADYVVKALEDGKRVLTTCAAGRNRSGLVNALVLTKKYGMSGEDAMRHIQHARPFSLTNEGFQFFLFQIPATF